MTAQRPTDAELAGLIERLLSYIPSHTEGGLDCHREARAAVASLRDSGSLVSRPVAGIEIRCMAPDARSAMEAVLQQWEGFRKSMKFPPQDESYSFAYWLFRHSGLFDCRASLRAEKEVAQQDEPSNAGQFGVQTADEAHRAARGPAHDGPGSAMAMTPAAPTAPSAGEPAREHARQEDAGGAGHCPMCPIVESLPSGGCKCPGLPVWGHWCAGPCGRAWPGAVPKRHATTCGGRIVRLLAEAVK